MDTRVISCVAGAGILADAKSYVKWLSNKTEKDYRLLSEAESWCGPTKTGLAGSPAILSLVLRGAGFPKANFDGASHQRLVVDTASFSARLSANQGFVHLHMVPRYAGRVRAGCRG